MNLRRVLVGDFVTNCYILTFSDRAVLIDPGDAFEKLERFCNGLPVTDILLTHGHLDHTAALGDFCDRYSPRVWMHKQDEDYLNDDILRAPASYPDPAWRRDLFATDFVNDGEEILLGQGEEALKLQVIHTPGHTPGSVCYYDEGNGFLFSGDTLFKGAEGRTDFPRSDWTDIKRSLKKLSLLPARTAVYPGHGFQTTIGGEPWIGEDWN
ncbi:MAG: MBL fold metallo-hydrolase [Clostridia bacterium]|nr:MBL fold metallo-hydrolase [Clostridia bacterium]